MARPRSVPTYRKHRKSGQAVVTLTDPSGRRRDVYLGTYGTAKSRIEYSRVIAEWEANNQRLQGDSDLAGGDLTIAELMVAFIKHAESHYRRRDGTPTQELANFKCSFRPLKELHSHTLASRFGPLALRTVREKMIEADLARRVINSRINSIRHVFKWAASLEMVPSSSFQAIAEKLNADGNSTRQGKPFTPMTVHRILGRAS